MADVWEIAAYVESHPNNALQRWRLAKKLYKEEEFRLALEHLQVLRNEWEPRLSVVRYLAATNFRLGRLDNAIQELEKAIGQWPEEDGLYAQLTHVLKRVENPRRAIEVWARLSESNGGNERAQLRLEALQEGPEAKPSTSEDSGRREADETPDAARGTAKRTLECPRCGAGNDAEFERCWQCHYTLAASEKTGISVIGTQSQPERVHSSYWLGWINTLLIAASVALVLWAWYARNQAADSWTPATLWEAVVFEFLEFRVLVGIALLVACPLAVRFGCHIMNFEPSGTQLATRLGILLATVAFLITWLPPYASFWCIALVIVAALPLLYYLLDSSWLTALGVWVTAVLVLILASTTVATAMYGLRPLGDAPSIVSAAHLHGIGTNTVLEGQTPYEQAFRCASTGSDWLDAEAGSIGVELLAAPHFEAVFLELLEDGEPVEFHRVGENPAMFVYRPVDPGRVYALRVTGEPGVKFAAQIRSLFRQIPAGSSEATPQ